MSSVATGIFVLFIAWLLTRDHALRRTGSTALWLPVLWITIIGSRPVSVWLGYNGGNADVDQEGSPVDRLFYLVLILAAFLVLQRRNISWKRLIAQNKWLAAYFIYLGISVLWSDDSFVSFKRWVKEIGNLCMVAIILSEEDPAAALKSVLFRCSCFLIPLSVLYIKYYPDLGRYFDRWTWQYSYGGVTTNKNSLGMGLFLCGMGLFWSFIDIWSRRAEHKKDVFAHLFLIAMCFWLWHIANSATSLACSVLSVAIMLGMRIPAVRDWVQRVGLFGVFIPVLLALMVGVLFNPLEVATESLGRNMTLTGRTFIWQRVLKSDINPVIGAGYCSFWDGARADRISEDLGFYFRLREAHNGYLEVYLNGGLIGLALILGVLFSNFRKAAMRVGSGSSFDAFRLAVLVGVVIYNMTESAFAGLEILWISLLLVVVEPLASPTLNANESLEFSEGGGDKPGPYTDSVGSRGYAAAHPG